MIDFEYYDGGAPGRIPDGDIEFPSDELVENDEESSSTMSTETAVGIEDVEEIEEEIGEGEEESGEEETE